MRVKALGWAAPLVLLAADCGGDSSAVGTGDRSARDAASGASSGVVDATVSGDDEAPSVADASAAVDASQGHDTSDAASSDAEAPDAAVDAGPIGDMTGVLAVPAVSFLASIGVCVHIAQGVDDASDSAGAMAFAGIRNLRDDGNPNAVLGWITVHERAGVRTCMLPNGDIPTTVAMATRLQDAGALLAVEGPNEPNNFPVTYEGAKSSSTTFAPVAHFQRDLYAAIHAEPSLEGVPLFHSSEAGGSEPDNVGLQFLTIPSGAGTTMPAGTRYADYANTHNYVCGHSSQLVDNLAWNASDPTLNGDWDGLYVEYGHTWSKGFSGYSSTALPGLPRVTTETGWRTQGSGSITQDQQGRVLLDLYLAAFKRGWSYTFVYMLRDDPSQGYWGLFDTAYNPKKSATYLHNLTAIVADTGARAPGRLGYAIASEPTTVHDLLLQRSDGAFELVVWDERWGGAMDSVLVSLGAPRSTVSVFDPTTGTLPVQRYTQATSVTLTLGDHPLVIEIAP